MALVENIICNIGHFKIIVLKGTVNVGVTLNKHGESHGDTIVLGDEKFLLNDLKALDNAQPTRVAVPLESSEVHSYQ